MTTIEETGYFHRGKPVSKEYWERGNSLCASAHKAYEICELAGDIELFSSEYLSAELAADVRLLLTIANEVEQQLCDICNKDFGGVEVVA